MPKGAAPAAPDPPAEDAEPERRPAEPLNEEALQARREAFREVFKGFPAMEVKQKSRAEREEKGFDEQTFRNYAYSELELDVLNDLLNEIKVKHGPLMPGEGLFLDLGSGVGKACVGAALLHGFSKVVGVEGLDTLNESSAAALAKYTDPEFLPETTKPEVQLLKGDFVAEFDQHIEPIAKEVTVCLAVSSCYGEEQLKAMTKLANLMPEGSVFITCTHKLEDSLIIDINKKPRQRRAVATKRALKRRGLEPKGVEIVLDAAENDPSGWRTVYEKTIEMEWGSPTVYMFRKHLYPYCYVGDLCVVTLLAEDPEGADAEGAEKQAEGEEGKEKPIKLGASGIFAIYAEPSQVQTEEGEERRVIRAILLDDPNDEPIEVGKIEPFSEEERKKALVEYSALVNSVSEVHIDDPEADVKAASEKLGFVVEPEGEPHEGMYLCREEAEEEGPKHLTEKCQKLLEELIPTLGLKTGVWAETIIRTAWPQLVEEQDTEGTGALPIESLAQCWAAMPHKLVEWAQGRLDKVEGHVPPGCPDMSPVGNVPAGSEHDMGMSGENE